MCINIYKILKSGCLLGLLRYCLLLRKARKQFQDICLSTVRPREQFNGVCMYMDIHHYIKRGIGFSALATLKPEFRAVTARGLQHQFGVCLVSCRPLITSISVM